MDKKTEFGSSLQGTANDVAFALETLKKSGFEIHHPAGVNLHTVACRILGIDSDDDVEQIVGRLTQAIGDVSDGVPVFAPRPMGMTHARGKFDIGASLAFAGMLKQPIAAHPDGICETTTSAVAVRSESVVASLSPAQRETLDKQ